MESGGRRVGPSRARAGESAFSPCPRHPSRRESLVCGWLVLSCAGITGRADAIGEALLANGPVSLAGLCLVRYPDQVSQVLAWSVRNPGLVREETDWQEEMAGLLGKLTPQEQQELSELLRDRLVSLGRHVPSPRRARANGSVDQPCTASYGA